MSEALPQFQLSRPASIAEVVATLKSHPDARLCAGGTDLIVNMRRGLVETDMLVDLGKVAGLNQITETKKGLEIGAGVTLADLIANKAVQTYTAVLEAAGAIAGPSHRQSATVGGNLCLDTRCLYYNQSHWWRKSNNFCLKYKGDTCHVAPQGNRCRAAFSGDLAPALIVFGAEITLVGPDGTRRLKLADFYHEDGAAHLDLKPGEILTTVHLPKSNARSAYGKVRIREIMDFPLAGVALVCSGAKGDETLSVAVTGTNSMPLMVELTKAQMLGADQDAFFAAINKDVQKSVSPQRTTTTGSHYRRLSIAAVAERLARELCLG
ncbi:MAG: 4-hydroxybenzoyl-CoA reductase subunit beta [Rhodobacteraceae bacterium]|nr:4-hydroxybenzoyl-CoA reductase subunit beta [Paracoccaceae bacterium]